MLPLRYILWWRVASVTLLGAVFLGTLLPAIWFRDKLDLRLFDSIDKLLHLLVFTALAVWFSGQYAPRAWWRVIVGLTLFGAMIEICQRLTASRSAEWLDFTADVVGILLGLLIARWGLAGWSLRVENWLLERNGVR